MTNQEKRNIYEYHEIESIQQYWTENLLRIQKLPFHSRSILTLPSPWRIKHYLTLKDSEQWDTAIIYIRQKNTVI